LLIEDHFHSKFQFKIKMDKAKAKQAGNDHHHLPFYKRKFPRDRYLGKGGPWELTEEGLPQQVNGWVPLTDTELLQADAQDAVLRRDKKREFLFTHYAPRLIGWQYMMKIEILHSEKMGFTYEAMGKDVAELEKKFWPTVLKLVAHFFSPRLLTPPSVHVPEDL